jgi:predicted tellurium resistance membrane protein TerC
VHPLPRRIIDDPRSGAGVPVRSELRATLLFVVVLCLEVRILSIGTEDWRCRILFARDHFRLCSSQKSDDNYFNVLLNTLLAYEHLKHIIFKLQVTDLIFAVDSVSAIVAQIPDLYLAYTACIFAMLGLRATFFMIDELIRMFTLLK